MQNNLKIQFIHTEKCFNVNYNFIIAIPEYFSNVFLLSCSLKYFPKNTTIYNSCNKSVIFMSVKCLKIKLLLSLPEIKDLLFLHIVVYFCTTFILHKGNYISKSYKNIGIKVKKNYQWYLKAKPTTLIIFLSRFLLVLSSF